MLNDTIAAISTPVGEGGIGIVRVSGEESLHILKTMFVPKRSGGRIVPWRVHYGQIVDPKTRETVDEVLAVYMAAPNTYTREDVVEISCHGGPLPLRSILALALQQGARLAHPGEFTLRAFVNGRIDLAQAESVLDIINAKTEIGLRVAMSQLGGRLSQEIKGVRALALDVLAYLTATIDFAEDEIPKQDIASPLDAAIARTETLLRNADAGIIYRQGLRTAIVGRPNVGKSSLLNALLRESRAIVTPIPGTTRDTLEETVNIQGIPIVLVDTAGIIETDDLVERLGVERSRQAIEMADLVLFVVDGSCPLQDEDREIAALVKGRPRVVVVNKSDMPGQLDLVGLSEALTPISSGPISLQKGPDEVKGISQREREYFASPSEKGRGREATTGEGPPEVAHFVHASATTGDSLNEVEEAIVRVVLDGGASASDALLVSNPRHKDALARALANLQAAKESLRDGLPSDFVAIDLTSAVEALGEITGETVAEDLLDNIFSRFCIGK